MFKANKLKKVLGEKLREHVSMRDFTSIKIGGVCDYFFEATNVEEIIKAVMAAREDKMPFFIMGSGSNILVSDYGFGGLVIRNNSGNVAILPDKSQIIADSGVNLSQLILKSVNNGLGGLESLYGIYGTLGGAIYGNAGAYTVEMFNFVKSVTMLTPENKLVSKNREWFEPSYRESKLKREKLKDWVILTVKLQLAHNKKEQLFGNLAKVKTQRDEKLLGLGPSCGSIFRNPKPGKSFKDPKLAKINSAGYMLEQVEAKKMRVGDAGVFMRHANIIENKGKASANEVRLLIEEMKSKVHEKFKKNLVEEIEYVGQWD